MKEREMNSVGEESKKKNETKRNFYHLFLNASALDDDRLHAVLFLTLFGTVMNEFKLV